MTRMNSLYALMQRAESLRDATQADAARAAAELVSIREQHARLATYRGEYEQRYRERFAEGGTIDVVRCYHSFMSRLGQAIDHQAHAVRKGETRAADLQSLLLQHEMELAAVRKLIERRTEEQGAAQARREQRNADEISARVAIRKNAETRAL